MSIFSGKEKPQMPTPIRPMVAPVASTVLETVIGPNANFKGTVQSDGGMKIDGIFEGQIELAGNLVIGEGGKVIADIKAQNVSVSGAVKGTINANGRLEILSNGKVWADISVSSFLIDEGGFFRGQSVMPGEPDFPMLEAPNRKKTSSGPVVDAEGAHPS
jgi:cytoskeletal protein CcmA (bactofilin family)